MRRFEPVLERFQPHAVVVVGDVNSTLACALVTSKFLLDVSFDSALARGRRRPLVVHVEAGLRSRDEDMPEEINRRLTDSLADLLFVTEPSGVENLAREGVAPERVHLVGNVMIDTLLAARERARGSDVLTRLGLDEGGYGLVTLHRPSNVDDPQQLCALLAVLDEVARQVKLCFPVHPRTRARLAAARSLYNRPASVPAALPDDRWVVTDPVGYLDFLRLTASARLVLTDSGGVQEETTILAVRCLTLRDNTERPITIDEGSNMLAGTRRETIWPAFERAMSEPVAPRQPRLWDGRAALRIADELARVLP
jgi:UDP-N-acetylglucosamine 2-epimerase (non-hydrolysing)